MAPRGSFIEIVFRLVFFHQSICGIDRFPPQSALNDDEKYLYFDPILYKYMGIMMYNDSSSYHYIADRVVDADQKIQIFDKNKT